MMHRRSLQLGSCPIVIKAEDGLKENQLIYLTTIRRLTANPAPP